MIRSVKQIHCWYCKKTTRGLLWGGKTGLDMQAGSAKIISHWNMIRHCLMLMRVETDGIKNVNIFCWSTGVWMHMWMKIAVISSLGAWVTSGIAFPVLSPRNPSTLVHITCYQAAWLRFPGHITEVESEGLVSWGAVCLATRLKVIAIKAVLSSHHIMSFEFSAKIIFWIKSLRWHSCLLTYVNISLNAHCFFC